MVRYFSRGLLCNLQTLARDRYEIYVLPVVSYIAATAFPSSLAQRIQQCPLNFATLNVPKNECASKNPLGFSPKVKSQGTGLLRKQTRSVPSNYGLLMKHLMAPPVSCCQGESDNSVILINNQGG